jgi:hypothetical protein
MYGGDAARERIMSAGLLVALCAALGAVCCRAVAEPMFLLSADGTDYRTGDTVTVSAAVRPEGLSADADGYAGIRTPGGRFYYYNGRAIVADVKPVVRGWSVSDWSGVLIRRLLNGTEPAGGYTVYAALCRPGGDPFEPGERLALASCAFSIRSPEAAIPYGKLRVFCSEDINLIRDARATLSIAGAFEFTVGDPWYSFQSRRDFEERLNEFRRFTGAAHASGVTVISYIAQYLSGEYGKGPEGLFLNAFYRDRWGEYADYFGPRPAVGPAGWVQIDEEGNPAEYVWVSPDGDERDYENPCCPNNPSYREYMKGVIRLACATGIDGVYLDWSTIVDGCCYCRHCRAAFEDYVRRSYGASYLRGRYGIGPGGPFAIPRSRADPLMFEWRRFRSRSEAEFHRILRDHARAINPGFLMSGNVYGGGGFATAAFFDGSDIELIGAADDILYSELAGDTSTPEEGQKYLSRNDGGTRVSNSPLIKQIVAAGGDEKPVLVYCFYAESPNPVPREGALYNLVKLALAESFANRAAFRRVEEENSLFVKAAARDFYSFLALYQDVFAGAHTEANVAVLASLLQAYGESPSYYLSAGRTLADARIPYRLITERDLTAAFLSPLKALVLPYVPLMSDTQAEAVRGYVAGGGCLISIGPSGRKDEYGQDRPELALADVMGISLSALPWSVVNSVYGSGNAVYIPLGTEVAEDYRSFIRGEISGPLGSALAALPTALDGATGKLYAARWSGPGMLEVNVMKNVGSGTLIAHLVNYDVTLDGAVTRTEDIPVELLLPPGTHATTVTLLSESGASALPFTHAGSAGETYVQFIVPRVDIYAAAVVSYE